MPRRAYLDSSALVKLVAAEPETAALRQFVGTRLSIGSSVLARIEVVRAARRYAREDDGRALLSTVQLLELDDDILERASVADPPSLSSFDAVHLATAVRYQHGFDVFVGYDARLVAAARAAGLAVTSPA